MPSWAIALLAAGAALLALGTRIGAWWRGRTAAKERARLEAQVASTELARDVAVGEATVLHLQTKELADHVAQQTEAAAIPQEVADAASAAGNEPTDRIVAVDDWVREHQDGPSPGANSDRPPGVRKP